MKIALLQCDHVQESFRHLTGGNYDDLFRKLFADHAPQVDLIAFDVTKQQYPPAPNEFDAFLTTGSAASVYEDLPWVNTLKKFVYELFESNQTFVGVCFGHQLMAEALGGTVASSNHGWEIGVKKFDVQKPQPWMQPVLDQFSVLMSCQDQVENLPAGSTVLAGSDLCPIGMYTVGERFLGIQGHPEFPVDYARALLEDRVDRIGAAVVEDGLASLKSRIHAPELTQWIVQFIESAPRTTRRSRGGQSNCD